MLNSLMYSKGISTVQFGQPKGLASSAEFLLHKTRLHWLALWDDVKHVHGTQPQNTLGLEGPLEIVWSNLTSLWTEAKGWL